MDIVTLGAFIPYVFCVAAVLIIWIVSKYNAKEKKNRYDLIAKLIEKGQPIPENFFAQQDKKLEQKSFEYFKNAITFLALSVAFLAILIFQKLSGFGNAFAFMLLCAFFMAFGVAFLIIGFLRHAKEKEEKRENTGK